MTKYYFNVHYMHNNFVMDHPFCIDRSGVFPHHEQMELITPIGEVRDGLEFSDIMYKRAQELVDAARERQKKLYVFWSGGLDSTALFFALREVAKPEEMAVVVGDTSYPEYPGFVEKYIKDVYEIVPTDMIVIWRTINDICKKGIAVSGEIGDQLMGSLKFMDHSRAELTNDWRVELAKQNTTFVDQFEPFVAACPQPVENWANFYWWLNYSMKYQIVQMRMLRNNKTSVLGETMHHFYDCKDFNDWTVSNPIEVKFPDYSPIKYKMPMREFILKHTGDAEYCNTKLKVRSLEPRYGRLARAVLANAITTDYQREY